ncbi:head GIN domain-containing protein [Flavobacterium columnare]|uniref:head GIN domain-containing protein n=1 Tax=Flavobacterium columnare TaxID=996 RepID=UPI0013D25B6C|nr:head GIN domain-containing protein [Flavobacterium columnare]
MKKHVIAFSLFAVSVMSAQTSKSLGTISKVTGFDQIEIHLVPATENKIELKGTNSEAVELVTKDGELKVRMPFGKMLKGDAITATVYFKALEAVEANEGSLVTSDATLKSAMFDIIAKEGGKVDIAVEASKINVKTSSGGVVTLGGKTQTIDAVSTAGGILAAKNCVTQQATVTVNAGGQIDISAYDVVDAKARAGGNITIYGKPKQVNEKTIFGGNITIRRDKNQ